MRVRAAVLETPRGAVRVETMSLGEPGPGEVMLGMEACGVCHSDLFVAGLEKLPLAPLTLGHEGIGRVTAVGPEVTGWRAGDRAGVTFLGVTCGACDWCLTGRERFCRRQTNFGYTLQGVMAESACVPAAALVRVPEDLAALEAAPLCCAGWTAAGALREAAVQAGETVALFGFGGLGHLALQLARRLGARVAAVDVSEEKLAAARAGGAETALQAGEAGRTLQKELGGVDAALVLTPSPRPSSRPSRRSSATAAWCWWAWLPAVLNCRCSIRC